MRVSNSARLSVLLLFFLFSAACEGDSNTDTTTTVAPRTETTTPAAGPETATATTVNTEGDSADSATELDPAAAQSCVELADMFVESTQRVLNATAAAEAAGLEGEATPEVVAAFDDHMGFVTEPGASRAQELPDCGFVEFLRLLCERAPALELQAPEQSLENTAFPSSECPT